MQTDLQKINADLREVYFLAPILSQGRKRLKNNNAYYFSTAALSKISVESKEIPIFLCQKHALQYRRFIDINHTVLKAYVHDTAITGTHEALQLKSEAVTTANIHGYFPAWGKGRCYIVNPHFDKNILNRYINPVPN